MADPWEAWLKPFRTRFPPILFDFSRRAPRDFAGFVEALREQGGSLDAVPLECLKDESTVASLRRLVETLKKPPHFPMNIYGILMRPPEELDDGDQMLLEKYEEMHLAHLRSGAGEAERLFRVDLPFVVARFTLVVPVVNEDLEFSGGYCWGRNSPREGRNINNDVQKLILGFARVFL